MTQIDYFYYQRICVEATLLLETSPEKAYENKVSHNPAESIVGYLLALLVARGALALSELPPWIVPLMGTIYLPLLVKRTSFLPNIIYLRLYSY